MQPFSKTMLHFTSKWNNVEEKICLWTVYTLKPLFGILVVKKKILIQRNRWYTLFHAWESVCLFHMYVNFFHYMTLCLWVLNHSHICLMKKHMKNLCTSYFHAILLFWLVEAIQNCQMLILHGDFGLSDTQYSDDVSLHWHYDTYKKSKYTLVQFTFGN